MSWYRLSRLQTAIAEVAREPALRQVQGDNGDG
jgi:hypothetical protein